MIFSGQTKLFPFRIKHLVYIVTLFYSYTGMEYVIFA